MPLLLPFRFAPERAKLPKNRSGFLNQGSGTVFRSITFLYFSLLRFPLSGYIFLEPVHK
jgi:hypothetical protein